MTSRTPQLTRAGEEALQSAPHVSSPAPARLLRFLSVVGIYLLATLAWAASGRADARFAESASLFAALTTSTLFAMALVAAQVRGLNRANLGWIAFVCGTGLIAAAEIAGWIVIRSDRALLWRPVAIAWLQALGSIGLIAGIALSERRRNRQSRVVLDVLGLTVPTLLAVTFVFWLLTVLRDDDPARWTLLPGTIAESAAVVALLIVLSIRLRGNEPATTSLVLIAMIGGGWAFGFAALHIGREIDRPGVMAFGRWMLPMAALAGCVLSCSVLRDGHAPFQSFASEPRRPAIDTVTSPWITRATGGAFIFLCVAALFVGPPIWPDIAVLGVLAGLAIVAQHALVMDQAQTRADRLLQSTRELRRIASSDLLTGLPNRAALVNRLTEEQERARRFEQPISLCYVDIDRFKEINDTHGHVAGDLVLRAVAASLKSTARIIDVVGRYGGEEFLVIAPATWTADAMILGERLRAQISGNPVRLREDLAVPVTISIGIAGLPEHARGIDDLLEYADRALYASKAGGRNRVTLYEPALDPPEPSLE